MKPIIITIGDGPPLQSGDQILVRPSDQYDDYGCLDIGDCEVDTRRLNYRTWTPISITHPNTQVEVRSE